MSGDTVRQQVMDHLLPLIPDTWTVLPYHATIDRIDRTVVVLKHTKINKLAEAPMGWLSNEFVVTVVDPVSDPKTAENNLDEAVLALVTALDSHLQLNWTQAEKVLVNETLGYKGWDITLTVNTNPPTPE